MKTKKNEPKVMHSHSLTVSGDEHTKEVCNETDEEKEYWRWYRNKFSSSDEA